ncbi:PPE family domain protein [Mycobacterium kansasii]|uniref:PPE family domain protein n=1 Tax=Mycobacterium kansasii TaxID=1768 RepID=A0A1V3WV49_MYCKA|nr:PPE family domain protein [Mycobacterium kansasii]
MVYGALPPEINSGRMYAGPGQDRCWPPPARGMDWPSS